MSDAVCNKTVQARRLQLHGRVQGVGFRPFVFRLARRHGLRGWVVNQRGTVSVHVQGEVHALAAFQTALIVEAPAPSHARLHDVSDTDVEELDDFRIRASDSEAKADIHLPPDLATCDDCLAELRDPTDRRHAYPFINCAQCGPRYSLIHALPYDRGNTSMARFDLCPACRRDYHDPADRRFHAEASACPRCGPKLSFHHGAEYISGDAAALSACFVLLRAGGIVAVKGIGGYHLMCDARNEEAIRRLRRRKQRPHKPLAVMLPDAGEATAATVAAYVSADAAQLGLLRGSTRPIVLLPRSAHCPLPKAIAPGLDEIGVLLPYSPLHQLLLTGIGAPLIATSGNISGEPVISDNEDAESRLADIADTFLHHDRAILRPVDDTVYRFICDQARPLRVGRGTAPLELTLPFTLAAPVLAVGGHMKNTVALAWDDRVVISPHLGDLDSPRSLQLFTRTIADLQTLYGIAASRVIRDAHPRYGSHRWAQQCGLPITTVFHHHAHAAVLAGEYPEKSRWLVFTWDGVGLGEDGTLWGGEALLGEPGAWHRVASLRRFRLPGGEHAAREPWRSAASLCWETDRVASYSHQGVDLLRSAWRQGSNSPWTSAAGRFFDAAASLLGVIQHASYEAQAAMRLEALAATCGTALDDSVSLSLRQDEDGVLRGDWESLLPMLLDEAQTPAARAARFHEAMARLIADQASELREVYGDFAVGFCGGVFQNKLLSERAQILLAQQGFRVYLPQVIPMNDGGLCYGQIIEAAALLRAGTHA